VEDPVLVPHNKPLDVTTAPPSEVTSPPIDALVDVIEVALLVADKVATVITGAT
jgi:hypothetical protein